MLDRYGGEELVALLAESSHEGALDAAERMRRAAADRLLVHPVLGHLTASMGEASSLDWAHGPAGVVVAAIAGGGARRPLRLLALPRFEP